MAARAIRTELGPTAVASLQEWRELAWRWLRDPNDLGELQAVHRYYFKLFGWIYDLERIVLTPAGEDAARKVITMRTKSRGFVYKIGRRYREPRVRNAVTGTFDAPIPRP